MRLFGKNSVIERLRANPQSIKKIYIQHGFKGTLQIHKKARQWNIPLLPVTQSKMMKIGRDKNTQGVMADVDDFQYTPYEDLLEQAAAKNRTLVFMDGVTDPQNFGAIIRSLACLGRFSVVLPTHDSVSITETVLRVASGGDNYVDIAKVGNIGNAIKKAKREGFQVGGAVTKGGEDVTRTTLPSRFGLVVGSEQKGIRDVNQKLLDIKITIPMAKETLSFNVAHATAVLGYEITRQKKQTSQEG